MAVSQVIVQNKPGFRQGGPRGRRAKTNSRRDEMPTKSEEVFVKRRSFLKKAGVGLAAGTAVAAPAIVSAQAPTITWRMAASWPKSLDTLYGGAEFIAKRVAEITDGKFQIRTFAAGEIVPALQVLDAVQAG